MTVVLGHETITVLRRTEGVRDSLGVPARLETTEIVTGCAVQPLSTAEEIGDIDQVVTRWKLWAPAVAALAVVDAVVWRGDQYEVDGDPQTWVDATGKPSHQVCLLRRATG